MLLFRGYARSGLRLLLWSALCFVCLTLNNVLLFVDLPVFLAGAVTFGFIVAAMFVARFWRRTGDRLFIAFALLAINQAALHFFYVANEPSSLLYALRVLAFGIIIAAIVDKNLA